MKRTLIFALAAVAIIASCAKESPVPAEQDEPGVSRNAVVFSAGIETKTAFGTLADGKYPNLWVAGDKISVNGIVSTEVESSKVGTSSATFTVESVSAPYCVAYPVAAFTGYANAAANVTIPAEQAWADGTYDSAAMILIAKTSETNFNFNPVMCVLRITPSNAADAVKSISVKSLDGKKLSGAFTTDFETITPAAGASDVVTMTATTAVESGKDWFIAIPAGDYQASGLELTITDASNNTAVKVISPAKAYVAGKVYAADVEVVAEPEAFDYCYGNANCVIASPATALTFSVAAHPVAAEEFSADFTKVSSRAPKADAASIVWSEFTGDVTLSLNAATQELTVTTPAGEYGNALVAIKNGEETIWSFHVWVPEDDPTQTLHYNTFSSSLKPQVMPFYIGATKKVNAASPDTDKIKAVGLYYQWGRKDPFKRITEFTTSDQSSNKVPTILPATLFKDVEGSLSDYALDYTTKNPDRAIPWVTGWGWFGQTRVDYWKDNAKTAYDPCPEGYRILPAGAFPSGSNCNIKADNTTYVKAYSKGYEFIVGKDSNDAEITDFFVVTGDRYGSSTEPNGCSVTGPSSKIRFWLGTIKSNGALYVRANDNGTFYLQNAAIEGHSYPLPVRCMKIQ